MADLTAQNRLLLAKAMTEAELQADVIELAKILGYKVAHFRPAQTKRGWRTPVQGDHGFPDLVLASGVQTLFVELKAHGKNPTPAQEEWAEALDGVYVWRPLDWLDGTIQHVLQEGAGR